MIIAFDKTFNCIRYPTGG